MMAWYRQTGRRALPRTPGALSRSGVVLALCLTIVLFARGSDGLTRWLAAPAQAGGLAGTASVIDGDTLEVRGRRIRLHGIDAPESRQRCEDGTRQSYRCGQRAALALADRIGRAPVTCETRDTDRYGRLIAVCYQGTTDLNAWLVTGGHAVAYRRYSTDYVGEERLARAARRGLWAGRFVMPWDWRRGVR